MFPCCSVRTVTKGGCSRQSELPVERDTRSIHKHARLGIRGGCPGDPCDLPGQRLRIAEGRTDSRGWGRRVCLRSAQSRSLDRADEDPGVPLHVWLRGGYRSPGQGGSRPRGQHPVWQQLRSPSFPAYTLGIADLALSRTMAGYWTRFARTGNPNDDETAVHWPRFSRPQGDGRGVDKYLALDLPIQEGSRLNEALLFDHEVDPVSLDRVVHGLELNFVFGNNYGPPLFPAYALDSTDLELFHAMAGYWTRFASTGNPNSDDLTVVHWPAFSRPQGDGRGVDKYLALDLPIQEGLRLNETRCDFWEPYLLRSTTGAVPAATP